MEEILNGIGQVRYSVLLISAMKILFLGENKLCSEHLVTKHLPR